MGYQYFLVLLLIALFACSTPEEMAKEEARVRCRSEAYKMDIDSDVYSGYCRTEEGKQSIGKMFIAWSQKEIDRVKNKSGIDTSQECPKCNCVNDRSSWKFKTLWQKCEQSKKASCDLLSRQPEKSNSWKD